MPQEVRDFLRHISRFDTLSSCSFSSLGFLFIIMSPIIKAILW
jgi:hypothetical protein